MRVLLDRRSAERRRRQTACVAQRRWKERRDAGGREHDLAKRGFLIVRQAGALQWPPPWWGVQAPGKFADVDRHAVARDLARLIVGAIAAAHREKIAEGIRRDALFETLRSELEEGRRYYEENLDASAIGGVNYFDQAIVDILVKGQGNVPSKIW